LCFVERKGGEGKHGKGISSYVGKFVVHEKKNMCKQEHGRKLCVASTWSGIHRRISMTKPLDF
jgi:hypothetical protein